MFTARSSRPGYNQKFYLRLPCSRFAVYCGRKTMTRQQILDLYFLDARHQLVAIAAFLDRVERAGGQDDFRLQAFRAALAELSTKKKGKAKKVLLAFSDPTTKPVAKAEGKGACGAFKGK